jgi:hypothetical protein
VKDGEVLRFELAADVSNGSINFFLGSVLVATLLVEALLSNPSPERRDHQEGIHRG